MKKEEERERERRASPVNARLQLPRFLSQLPSSLLGMSGGCRVEGRDERNRARRKREREAMRAGRAGEEIAKRYLNIARARNSSERNTRAIRPGVFRSSRGFHVNKFLLTTYTSFANEMRSDIKQRGRFAGLFTGHIFFGEGEGTITREIRKRYIITLLVRSFSRSLPLSHPLSPLSLSLSRKFTSNARGC